MTKVSFIHYLLLPKGLNSVCSKCWAYVPAILLCSMLGDSAAVLVAAILAALVELWFGTARRVLNDLHDHTDDSSRGHRWTPAISAAHLQLVRYAVWFKITVGVAFAWWLDVRMAALCSGLVVLQLTYDRVAKPRSAMAANFAIGAAYATRGIVPIVASVNVAGVRLDETGSPLLEPLHLCAAAAIPAVIAMLQVFDWREAESHYIDRRGLRAKPGAEYFGSTAARRHRRISTLALAVFCASYTHHVIPGGHPLLWTVLTVAFVAATTAWAPLGRWLIDPAGVRLLAVYVLFALAMESTTVRRVGVALVVAALNRWLCRPLGERHIGYFGRSAIAKPQEQLCLVPPRRSPRS